MSTGWPPGYENVRTLRIATIGRRTERRHEVTVWFGVDERERLFVSSLPGRDWVKNIINNPSVEVTIRGVTRRMRAVKVGSEDDKDTVRTLWKRRYGLLARLMRLPRKGGVSFELGPE